MRYLICSDIHGSRTAVEKLVENFRFFNCDMMILLGDVLYHGPRNPLPENYEPKAVAEILNRFSGHIVACRGNCDSEVDQMMLAFPMLCDTALVCDSGKRFLISHGHIYSPEKLPPLCAGDVFLFGHTHVPRLEINDRGVVLCNPGSPSLPKNGALPGFALLETSTPDCAAVLRLYDMQCHVEEELVL